MIYDFDNKAIQGAHNNDPDAKDRVIRSNTYRDLSTVWVTPTREHKLDDQVVFQSWMPLQMPPNQKLVKLCIANAEVADAYNAAIELILKDDVKWKYVLTVEVDNLPPADGLLKLYENADKFDVIGGLYWHKRENATAHIYGDPNDPDDPNLFLPQPPIKEIQPCNGLGMGFTLFTVEMFRHIPKPWFKTEVGKTQDLYFFEKAKSAGYKFACDTRVKVGHMDFATRKIY